MKKNAEFLKVCKKLEIDPESIPPIMSFEIACEWLREKPVLPIVKHLPKKRQGYVIADYKLITITEALNLDPKTKLPWEPNYHTNETKYEPRFWVKADAKHPSGSGFSGSNFGSWSTASLTTCGSRLCLKSYGRWKFIVNVHEKLFIERTLILK